MKLARTRRFFQTEELPCKILDRVVKAGFLGNFPYKWYIEAVSLFTRCKFSRTYCDSSPHLYCLACFFIGCGRALPGENEVQQPIRVTSFPMPDEDPEAEEAELTVFDGRFCLTAPCPTRLLSVGWVNEQWDQTVIDSLLTWRFSTLDGGNPEGRWHRREIKVQFEEPFIFEGGYFRDRHPGGCRFPVPIPEPDQLPSGPSGALSQPT